MSTAASDFLKSFPKRPEENLVVDGARLSAEIQAIWEVRVPESLVALWRETGTGYFGHREIRLFGASGLQGDDRDIVSWNQQSWWRTIFPLPREGGPVLFAEDCFGNQFGFRYKQGTCMLVLFIFDTMELFVVNADFDRGLLEQFARREEILQVALADSCRAKLGVCPSGSHFAPILAPQLGGEFVLKNLHVEPWKVHFSTVLATIEALRKQPKRG